MPFSPGPRGRRCLESPVCCRESPSPGRVLPQPRPCTCIFSRSHPSCGAACEVPGHTQPPPAVAALAISSLCWDGSCYFFFLSASEVLEQCAHLGGQMRCPWFDCRDAQGVQRDCDAARGREPQGCGQFHFAAFGAGQGRADKRLSQSHCNCGFPNMGVYFLWFGVSFFFGCCFFFSPSHSTRPNNNNCFFFPWFRMEPLVQFPLRVRSHGGCPSHPLSLSCFASATEFGNSSAPQHALVFNMI